MIEREKMVPVPPPSGQSCGNCYFFRGDTATSTNGCHINPPAPNIPSQYMWPPVQPEDWCGDWKITS